MARDVSICTWTTPEKQQLTAFPQDVAAAVLPRLEDYFGLPYPFGKLDQIGVPDFEAGAMENAGAVTFREMRAAGSIRRPRRWPCRSGSPR